MYVRNTLLLLCVFRAAGKLEMLYLGRKEAIMMTVVLCCLLCVSASLLDWLTDFMLPWLFC